MIGPLTTTDIHLMTPLLLITLPISLSGYLLLPNLSIKTLKDFYAWFLWLIIFIGGATICFRGIDSKNIHDVLWVIGLWMWVIPTAIFIKYGSIQITNN